MSKRCKHVKQDGFNCGSYAFNLYMDDIDQGDLCDVHYWQAKAQRTWVGLTYEEWTYYTSYVYAEILDEIEQLLKSKNT
jgi:hypothetical protein